VEAQYTINRDKLRYKGAERAKRHLRPTAIAPQSVAALAATLPAGQWYRRTVSEGTKGPIAYDFARHRVTLCKDGLPDRTVWLVIKRTRGPEPTYAYAINWLQVFRSADAARRGLERGQPHQT
jgi:hypothetical protein